MVCFQFYKILLLFRFFILVQLDPSGLYDSLNIQNLSKVVDSCIRAIIESALSDTYKSLFVINNI